MAIGDAVPGAYFTKKPDFEVVVKVEVVVPGGYRARVRRYTRGGEPRWDVLSVNYLESSWGMPISEAAARSLFPDLDRLNALLDANVVLSDEESQLEFVKSVVQYMEQEHGKVVQRILAVLRQIAESTDGIDTPAVVEARKAALELLAELEKSRGR